MKAFLFIIFLLIALLIVAAKSVVVAKEDELLVVFRLEQVFRVYGPGLSVTIPFIDRVVRIKIDRIPDWQKLSEGELQERAAQIALKERS